MKWTRLAIPDVILFEPSVFEDERGHFYESFNQRTFEEATGLAVGFVQDNHSSSKKGVLRGLHYQLAPHAQGKLVRVVRGSVYDVAVDIRGESPTFGRWIAEILSAESRTQLWIPAGFAHGYLSLEDGTEFSYKVTDFYHPECERAIRWDDATLAITWPMKVSAIAPKDQTAPELSAYR